MNLFASILSRTSLIVLGLVCAVGCGSEAGEDASSGGGGSGASGGSQSGGSQSGGSQSGGSQSGGSQSSGSTNPTGGGVDASTMGNPYAGATMFINPDYVAEVQSSIDKSPGDAALLEKVKANPTAIWLDRIAMVPKVAGYLDAALEQQNKEGKPVVTTFVVYDLPNRDCHAKASNGELKVSEGGEEKYKTEYIDQIAAVFKAHPDQRIVAIIEPDSLPNLATNLNDPNCAAVDTVYREMVAYAIKTLAAPHVFMYLDTGHAGWLGWTDNQTKAAAVFKDVLDKAGGADLIRGFASNVANYTVLHEVAEQFDYQSNPCHDELTYHKQLSAAYKNAGITNVAWLIDTSRNGVGGIRHQWGYWCNNKGAGMGERPKADPAPGIDAYYWVKPPGESDGTSDPNAERFDEFCGYEDAMQNAPEAGQWFHDYFMMVAKNANPPL